MKIAIAQQNYHVGNFEWNTGKIIAAIEEAKSGGADLVLFSELAVCGYPAGDFFEFSDFVKKCRKAIDEIATHCTGIAALVGGPEVNPEIAGKDLYNSAWFLNEGKVEAVVRKTLLPTYDIFDENRYFQPADSWKVIEFGGKKLAVTICEDIWNLGDNPLYTICPMDKLMEFNPDFMLNLCASPFDYTHLEDRKGVVRANVLKYRIPMFYCNAVGAHTELIYDGSSLVFDKDGNLLDQLPMFDEAIKIYEIDEEGMISLPVLEAVQDVPAMLPEPLVLEPGLNIEQIHQALLMGIRDYFGKMGFRKAIVGSSGGMDSALTLALAVEALGKDNVHALLMPSQFSTTHSVDDAVQLSRNLGNPYEMIAIKPVFDAFETALFPVFGELPFDVAEENIQARTRGVLVMALANKFNYILLNTSNKSELAVGYGTLYGDMAGGLGILGDLYKLQVYELARYINRNGEIIPSHIITKPPSAELRPGQKDSDSLPPYNILDPILYQYIERRQGPDEIKAMGFDPGITDRVLRMVNRGEYKRKQFCPIIRVSPKAFGTGRRMPVVARYLS